MGKVMTMAERIRARSQQRIAEREGGKSSLKDLPEGIKFFKPKKGTMELDIIPYVVSSPSHPDGVEPGGLYYRRLVQIHYGVGAEEEAIVCPRTVGKKCPICEEQKRMDRDPNADTDLVKALKPKERELFNVIDLADQDAGVQVWEVSIHNFGKHLEVEAFEGPVENANFANLDDGKTLKIRFAEEKGKNGKPYLVADRIDFIDRDAYGDDILDQVVDFDACLNILSYDEIKKRFFGEGEGDAQENAEPNQSSGRAVHRPPPRSQISADTQEQQEEVETRDAEAAGLVSRPTSTRRPLARTSEESTEPPPPSPAARRVPSRPAPHAPAAAPAARRVPAAAAASTRHQRTAPPPPPDDGVAEEGTCPVGGTFGVDVDQFQECESCPQWDGCYGAKEEAELQARKSTAPARSRR